MRPLLTWIIFGLCLAVVLAAMGWISLTVLRLDRAEAAARRQAAREENLRLALWRMDSAVAPLIARENARPYFAYSAFYPAERAYTRMFAEIRRGEILMPSALLTRTAEHILLHFQFGPDGQLTSPQVPAGNMRDLAETRYLTHEKVEEVGAVLDQFKSLVGREALLASLSREEPPATAGNRVEQAAVAQEDLGSSGPQMARNVAEWSQRAQTYGQVAAQQKGAAAPDVKEGALHPVWVEESLVLARAVSVNGRDYVQGCWLDWSTLKQSLIREVTDLLPEADLAPVRAPASASKGRMLASLPVKVVPGDMPVEAATDISPIQLSLIVAWGCIVLASVAVAVLLRGAVSLSERRGAFVSAVTHEMRTPLTTFRMYAEMLAEGMVRDKEKRQRYLSTLRVEADRLAHLVENVLSYARLERGRARGRVESVSLEELLERTTARLAERAGQVGMELVVANGEGTEVTSVRTDPSAVEQILFNLVDNACKYAASASDRIIHLGIGRRGRFATLRIRDHGPGISDKDAKRLFRPFCKSAHDAANSAPGVGLGLALSRRLARSMGADLHHDRSVRDGAAFVLTLPLSST